MVGRNGGAFALAGFFVAGLLTLLRLTTPFSSGLVRFAKSHKEAATMATIPTETHPLLFVPFNADTDFTELADRCEQLATGLLENDTPELRMAFCGRLSACLDLLRPTLYEPIPPHLMESLTTNTLPDSSPGFSPEPELLCEYCQTLTKILLSGGFSPLAEQTLAGLLFELICCFADGLKAPRWIRTADGVKFIDEVMA